MTVVLCGLVFIIRRAPATRRYWIVYLSAIPSWRLLGIILVRFERAAILGAGMVLPAQFFSPLWPFLAGMAVVVAWLLYWIRNDQVRQTFPAVGAPTAAHYADY